MIQFSFDRWGCEKTSQSRGGILEKAGEWGRPPNLEQNLAEGWVQWILLRDREKCQIP
jgi:hypothetical protein